MKRIGATRITRISAIGGTAMLVVAWAAACGTNPVVHDLSSGVSPLPQTATRSPTALAGVTTTTVVATGATGTGGATTSDGTTSEAAARGGTADDRTADDWEGQRWDLGLISHVDLNNATIAFDREQIADPDGAFQSGPTITAEPMITSSSEVRNENWRLRTFVLAARPELLRPAVATGCPTAAAADWQTFPLSDLPAVRSQDPQASLSFDGSGRVVRIRLFRTC